MSSAPAAISDGRRRPGGEARVAGGEVRDLAEQVGASGAMGPAEVQERRGGEQGGGAGAEHLVERCTTRGGGIDGRGSGEVEHGCM